MYGSELIPARFLTLMSHAVLLITVLWARKENVEACLPEDYTESDFKRKDVEIVVGLSLGIALVFIELFGFLSGISMFFPTQGLLSTTAHCSASISLAYFVTDMWDCSLYWWIFGFCNALPACSELMILIYVFGLKKSV